MANSIDFQKSDYTAVISDLHLCEAEPVNARFPLWKKFKTREFFYDHVFCNFLKEIEKKSKGQPIELILNGDIFDFDSVTSLPVDPIFQIHWLEKKRGLYPRPERSKYKIQVILKDHVIFFKALSEFVKRGHKAVFVIGNHDLELHYPQVQAEILEFLDLDENTRNQVRFCDWFYISNKDTLVEHGNQYDPYCQCEDPINPFVQGYNYKTLRLPFGNLACRYILNGLGFFNPHVESNFIMSLREYIVFFYKYMMRAQPLLIWDWFWGSSATLWVLFKDRVYTSIRDPLKIEDRVNHIAEKANAEPRMVRELKELFVPSAASNIFLIARELWLDRAFIFLIGLFITFQIFLGVKQILNVSMFWMFIPILLLAPFFIFYSRSVTSLVSSYKEPNEKILATASRITQVNRIIYGHTHEIRHEMIGAVEHLNSGCWSAAFLDVECTKSIDQKTFVWIEPSIDKTQSSRQAKVLVYDPQGSYEAFTRRRKKS